ncbi:uncharacterized protein BJ171DRAFT_618777 [Polychytrium aggregatum]|uniref:uncharacterized protein n=1 Tax=Polychytrium aggregatum TaxID=110093 RepID=UPI0022FE99BB|nr:uncharacterized protein BJ171DRAFT_618777 [Polychytrium aggregatum]KAI9204663.1 hypothetical protein BJ171DRAFT_618777 [Polychytrium aggregatum]
MVILSFTKDTETSTAVTAGNPAPAVQLWGFDPLELLERIEFPNDRNEQLLRVSKASRMRAVRRMSLEPSDDPAKNVPRPIPPENSRRRTCRTPAEVKAREEEAVFEQLARSAAAVIIQSCFKGWLTRRKYLAVVCYRMSQRSVGSGGSNLQCITLPSISDLSVQERLLAKYKRYCSFFEKLCRPPPTFPFFCAAFIQAYFRMWVTRRTWIQLRLKTLEEQRKGMEVLWTNAKKNERLAGSYSLWDQAAKKIQQLWKSYYNIKIYHFYRDLIKFRERGDPRKLLKFINPKEAALIDGASGIHVRFRLGGSSFPPKIYYKIFIHNNMIDMNAFSPRDYTQQRNKQPLPKDLFCNNKKIDQPHTDGWYVRHENNGWRCVSDATWTNPFDPITITTSEVKVPFHHLKLKRRDELAKEKKLKRLKWLQKMYQEGRHIVLDQAETNKAQPPAAVAAAALAAAAEEKRDSLQTVPGVSYEHAESTASQPLKLPPGRSMTPVREFKDEYDVLSAIAELETETDNWDDMLKWSRALDFDDYFGHWMGLATTGRSDDPSTFDIGIDSDNESLFNVGQTHAPADGATAVADGVVPAVGPDATTPVPPADAIMVEIDLFRSIAKEQAESGDGAKKARPWSGRSARSAKDLFV